MLKKGRKTLIAVVAVIVAVAACGVSVFWYQNTFLRGRISAASSAARSAGKASFSSSSGSAAADSSDDIENGTILQAFGWSFKTIQENMPAIADAGYTAVQTMPASAIYNGSGGSMAWWNADNSAGGHWWWVYQPTDYTVGNYVVGTEDDLKAMCQTAKQYGVRVIVDVVANHTTSTLSAVSSNLAKAAGGSGAGTLFHTHGIDTDVNYNVRESVIDNEMGGLPDLNTENTGLQNYLISYLKTLISDGVSGFRWDAAKHIGLPDETGGGNFWTRMLSTEVTGGAQIFNYGEILPGTTTRISSYAKIMHVTASEYGETLRNVLTGTTQPSVRIITSGSSGNIDAHIDSSRLVRWVESHDNYLNDGTYSISDSKIELGWALITARAGSATLFFDRPAGSSASNPYGENTLGIAGDPFYKDAVVSGVNHFRSAMKGQKEHLHMQGDEIMLIDRGHAGTCIVNLGDAASLHTKTDLANGTYTDPIGGGTFTVSKGILSGTIKGGSVVVLYKS